MARIEERVVWGSGIGRPRQLTLRQAVKATVMYFKTNVTEEVIGELLFVDQSTISRAISDLESVIIDALAEFVPDLAEEMDGRVGVVDGSLCPCWSWADAPELRSGKHKTTGHSHQFVCDLAGDLMYVSDPLPGKTHDAKAIVALGLADIWPTSCATTTPSPTKVSSAPDQPPLSGNPSAANSSTGKKSSTPRSIKSAMSSNAPSRTSKPGVACSPTTAAHSAPTRQRSARFERSTFSNCVLHKPPSCSRSARRPSVSSARLT